MTEPAGLMGRLLIPFALDPSGSLRMTPLLDAARNQLAAARRKAATSATASI
jgi:hypothetical protein